MPVGYGLNPASISPASGVGGAQITASPSLITSADDSVVAVSDILVGAVLTLADPENVRWPIQVLCTFIDDAIKEMAIHKPDALQQSCEFLLQEGSYQSIAPFHAQILKITRNLATLTSEGGGSERIGRRAISMIDREGLDAFNPEWSNPEVIPRTTVVKHAIYEPTSPRVFMVYPPNDGSGIVEMHITSVNLPIVAVPGTAEDQTQKIMLPSIYTNAVRDYVCYRAFSTDDEVPQSGQRSVAHYQQFATALGINTAMQKKRNPDTTHQVTRGEDNR